VAEVAVLPEVVRNRIAAGEVIERPASAVKELVENSLDAGATRVDVEIEQGGRRRIRVADDGRGMTAEDLALAVERFATSKLRTEKDLFSVTTMGFRGEALPSMAAVAELEITARGGGSREACRLRTEPDGTKLGPEPAAGSRGTTVELRSLFARTPARLKFLRSDATEVSAVAQVVQRLALARPEVAFRLRSDDREVFSAPAGQDLRERAGAVLGEEAARELIEVSAGEGGWLALEGLVAGPGSAGRRDRKWGFLFLNRRFVRDRMLAHAATAAYQSVMPPGRFPTYVLMLEMDPAQVDVNVHPAKYEVRFRSPRPLHEFVRGSVREALRKAGAPVSVERAVPGASGGAFGRSPAGGDRSAPPREYDLWGRSGAASDVDFVQPRGGSFVGEAGTTEVGLAEGGDVTARSLAAPHAAAGPTGGPSEVGGAGRTAEPPVTDVRVIGRTSRGFVIVETATDLRIVDPHALHERILYERFSAAAGGGAADSQTLLVPETVELSPADVALFGSAREPLERLGFVAEPFGGRTVVVRAVPSGVPATAAGEVLREVLSDIDSGGSGSDAEPIERIRRSLACRAAVKLGSRLAESEIVSLVRDAAEAPATCPHGRPVAWVVTHEEIARRVGR
jgi:DNA mismatch repair protein MutL